MSLRLPARKLRQDPLAPLATPVPDRMVVYGYSHELEPIFLLLEALFKGRAAELPPMSMQERQNWLECNTPYLYDFLIGRSQIRTPILQHDARDHS